MDPFDTHSSTLTAPIRAAAAVTPADGTDLAVLPRAIYVGAPGDVALTTVEGQQVVLANVPAGSLLPIRAARIRATGTTAAAIVALW